MNLNEAINITAEEAVRCRRLADDMADPPMDSTCMRHAQELRQKADAMDKLVNVARAFAHVAGE